MGSRPTPLPLEELRQKYESGTTQTELAAHYGTTQKVIWAFMKRHGIKARVAAKRDQCGSKNSSWKQDATHYTTLHNRVEAARGRPKYCTVCGENDPAKRYEWASLTKNYADIYDYQRMCKTCHVRFDDLAAPRRKLTREQVSLIRERLAAGDRPIDVSRNLSVSHDAVHRIKRGESYVTF